MTSPISTQYSWPQSYSASTGSQPSAAGSTNSYATSSTNASSPSSQSAAGGQPPDLQQILSIFAQLLQTLLQALPSLAGSTPSSTGTSPSTGGGTPTQTTSSNLGNAATQRNVTTDPTQKQRLNDNLNAIAQDPEGAKLLQAAVAKGYTFEVGNLDANTNGDTLPDQKKIIINPNAPDFTKTLAHELVHAATDQDGDSKDEEGKADVIGFRIASRILGQPEPNEQQTYNNKVSNPAYAGLQASNNVDQTLRTLGLVAFTA